MLLVGADPSTRGQRVAREITEIMAGPVEIDGREIEVTVSIGLAVSQSDTRLSDDLLRDADVAMYEAKQRGRDQYVTFDDSMQERVWERLMLESALRHAVERDQLQLYYQPIVDLTTGNITKLEALLRWQHPTRGLLMPAEFVAIAEETGLIRQIGDWVLGEACRQAREWIAESPGRTIPAISVNLSPRQFLHPHLAEDIRRLLKETGLPARYLELEITESTAMEDPRMVARTLKALKELDVLIALDDFGTGYSGLSYLTRFPIDTLKIDRSFIEGLGNSAADLAIVQTILAFSRSLGLATVAEGIETLDQHDQLVALGCTHGQGYYFSTPVPAEDVGALLRHAHLPARISPVPQRLEAAAAVWLND
jgi:EAL domain-containing protein (putative c-di-GMP-specific phosphodiesterase class I)